MPNYDAVKNLTYAILLYLLKDYFFGENRDCIKLNNWNIYIKNTMRQKSQKHLNKLGNKIHKFFINFYNLQYL